MPDIRIPAALPEAELQPLLAASMAEGHSMVARLSDEWLAGSNRFDRPGEVLSGAYAGSHLADGVRAQDRPFSRDPGAKLLYAALGLGSVDEEVDEETATHFLAL